MADDIFSPEELEAEQTQVSPEDEKPPEQQPRAPDGKFAPKEPEAAEPPAEAPPPEDDKPKPGTVPQGALHAEREKRKGVEAELVAAREQLAALAKMREQVAARKPADLPPPDDPAAVEHLRARLAEVEQSQTRIGQQMDNDAINRAEMEQLGGVIAQSEAEYRQAQPDYDDAIRHVVMARANELALYGMTPPQIQQTISEEATDIVRTAVAQGRNPAELAYQIAQQRGYRPTTPEAPSLPASSPAQAQIDALANARGQSKSLGSAPGATPQTLNAEAIASMDADEFERLYSTPEGKRLIDNL